MDFQDVLSFVLHCAGVGFTTRQVGNHIKPSLIINMDDQGMIFVKSQSTFKTIEMKFKLNDTLEETNADDTVFLAPWFSGVLETKVFVGCALKGNLKMSCVLAECLYENKRPVG
uniref:Uncharacterized protein n=1 Tax=Hucho hucho TaxID=62062 RepID=A0A4W5RSM6_9TELE